MYFWFWTLYDFAFRVCKLTGIFLGKTIWKSTDVHVKVYVLITFLNTRSFYLELFLSVFRTSRCLYLNLTGSLLSVLKLLDQY